jgi:type IV pilus assembly protein PilW
MTGTRYQRGTTLVELLIAMVVALIATGAVYSVYSVQQRHFRNQQLVQTAQQNLRGAMLVIESEIRMAGYDPEDVGGFGLVDIRRYDIVKVNEPDIDGQPVLYYTYDIDGDGRLDDSNRGINKEHPKIRISDVHADGRICLTWDNGSGRRPLARNIQHIGFAYAVDADNDGCLDRWADGEHLIWAVDSDNDNLLDTHIDTNDDGLIDEKDDVNGDHKIDPADGGLLNPPLPLDAVRSVRVWLMAVTSKPIQGVPARRMLVVADRIFPPADDGLKRLVLQSRIECRNL